jgi:hypothetical protein
MDVSGCDSEEENAKHRERIGEETAVRWPLVLNLPVDRMLMTQPHAPAMRIPRGGTSWCTTAES